MAHTPAICFVLPFGRLRSGEGEERERERTRERERASKREDQSDTAKRTRARGARSQGWHGDCGGAEAFPLPPSSPHSHLPVWLLASPHLLPSPSASECWQATAPHTAISSSVCPQEGSVRLQPSRAIAAVGGAPFGPFPHLFVSRSGTDGRRTEGGGGQRKLCQLLAPGAKGAGPIEFPHHSIPPCRFDTIYSVCVPRSSSTPSLR